MQDARSRETLGYFYMDLFPREGKYGHAAMWDLQAGSLDRHGRRQAAVAAMVCNFPRPSATTPSLMEHKQVRDFCSIFIVFFFKDDIHDANCAL